MFLLLAYVYTWFEHIFGSKSEYTPLGVMTNSFTVSLPFKSQ